jgi:hypothetical protein
MEEQKKEQSILFRALQNIRLRDMKTLEEIKMENKEILTRIVQRFCYYENNKLAPLLKICKDKDLTLVEDTSELNKGDTLYMIDLHRFYNLKLEYIGFFIECVDNKLFRLKISPRKKACITKKLDNKIFFRSLSDKDKLKMKLYEILN